METAPHRRLLRQVLGPTPVGPMRRFFFTVLVTAIGQGAWLAAGVLFLTRSVALTPNQVGVGLLVAGLSAILATTPIGILSDRLGAKPIYLVLHLIRAVAMVLYVFIGGFWAFLALSCLFTVTNAAAMGVRTALVAAMTTPDTRVDALAQARVMSHIGFAIGGLIGAAVIQADNRPAYVVMLLVNAATYLVAGLTTAALGPVPHHPTPREHRPRALNDSSYLAVTLLISLLTLNWGLLSIGIPLWVAYHTDAPRWTSGAILVINAVAIALLQVRFAQAGTRPMSAPRAGRLAGLTLAASCLLFASTGWMTGTVAVAVLLVSGLVYVIGELLTMVSSWGLAVGLMPESAKGEFQGMAATGTQAAQTIAPLVMTVLIAGWGQPGWLVLALVFAATGLSVVATTRWAVGRRTNYQP